MRLNLLSFIAAFFLITGCQAEETKKETILQTSSFIFVDLNHDGLETISLKQSNVDFDVDGDGKAERTEWISADNGMLAILTNEENRNITQDSKRLRKSLIGGLEKLKLADKNSDGFISDLDYENGHPTIGILLIQDKDLDGIPESTYKETPICTIDSVMLKNKGGKIICSNKKVYDFEALELKYMDINTRWNALCKKIKRAASEYKELCAE